MKKSILKIALIASTATLTFAKDIKVDNIALNPEGIEYNKKDNTLFLSSLNAMPIIKVNLDGTYKKFASGEKFPLSTAGLQVDYKNNKLYAAAFNGLEIMDKDPKTKGVSFLRVYNLDSGVLEKEINLSSLAPKKSAYFANDLTIDSSGNIYITDWYANLIYKVDTKGEASIFWRNNTKIKGAPNGIDFSKDGYLVISLIKVNNKGIYTDYGLVKIPTSNPSKASLIDTSNTPYAGFDGMVITKNGTIIGVTNNQKSAGGNLLLELSSSNNFKSVKATNKKDIPPSTTVATTPNGKKYIINQDFSNNNKKSWVIQEVKF